MPDDHYTNEEIESADTPEEKLLALVSAAYAEGHRWADAHHEMKRQEAKFHTALMNVGRITDQARALLRDVVPPGPVVVLRVQYQSEGDPDPDWGEAGSLCFDCVGNRLLVRRDDGWIVASVEGWTHPGGWRNPTAVIEGCDPGPSVEGPHPIPLLEGFDRTEQVLLLAALGSHLVETRWGIHRAPAADQRAAASARTEQLEALKSRIQDAMESSDA